jgi:quinol monooxygenase YgiN
MKNTEAAGYMYMWEYLVDPGKLEAFLRAYGPAGTWVALFRQVEGYICSELHRDRANPLRFVSIDYWQTASDWDAFRDQFSAEFEALDEQCEALTVQEREIGRFGPVNQ